MYLEREAEGILINETAPKKKGIWALYLFCLQKNGDDKDMIFAMSRQICHFSSFQWKLWLLLSTHLAEQKEDEISHLFIQFKIDIRRCFGASSELWNLIHINSL